MASETPIAAQALVRQVLSEVTYLIAFPNGKEIIGHLARPLRGTKVTFQTGEWVHVEMTPYDFSKARIVGSAQPGSKA